MYNDYSREVIIVHDTLYNYLLMLNLGVFSLLYESFQLARP